MKANQCPRCGDKLRKRTSKAHGSFRQARRECVSCDYADVALIKPEQVIQINVVGTTSDQPRRSETGV